MKERHTGTRVTFLLLLLISWESDRWKLVCQIGSLSNRSLGLPLCKQQHQSIPSPILPQPFIIPTKFQSFISAWLSLTFPAASLSFLTLLLTSVLLQLFENCFSTVPPTCYHGSQPTSSPQTLMLQYMVPLQFLHHTLSVVSYAGMDGVEEEIIVCLCRVEQTDRQMDSPSDAPQR